MFTKKSTKIAKVTQVQNIKYHVPCLSHLKTVCMCISNQVAPDSESVTIFGLCCS